jgi:hypothetical protein
LTITQAASAMSQAAFLAILCLTLACSGNGRKMSSPEDLANLMPNHVGEWKQVGELQRYNRESIFDYIDGAGEVYLQYGFRDCVVADFTLHDEPRITVEIDDMGSSQDAYGMMTHVREAPDIGIGQGSQKVGSTLYFWQDRYFVSISPERKTDTTEAIMPEIARAIISRIGKEGSLPELPTLLPKTGLHANSIRYFHSYQSLNFHYYLASENILDLSDSTDAVLADYDSTDTKLLLVRYPSESQASQALESFVAAYIPDADSTLTVQVNEGQWVSARQDGELLIIVFDAPDAHSAEKLIDAVQSVKSNQLNR